MCDTKTILNDLKPYENYIDFELTKFVSDKKITNWLPFIGKNYNKPEKTPEKVLIVGLSHYDKNDNKNWSNALGRSIPNIESVVGNGLGIYSNNGINDNRLFRGLECVFFNNKKSELVINEMGEKRKKLWNSIAFHQLIEIPINGTTKHKETKKTRIEGLNKLVDLIKLIKPNHIIMMSKQWKYHRDLSELLGIKDNEIKYFDIVPGKSNIRTVLYNNAEYNFTFNAINHPSYFRYVELQHKLLKESMPKFIDYLEN